MCTCLKSAMKGNFLSGLFHYCVSVWTAFKSLCLKQKLMCTFVLFYLFCCKWDILLCGVNEQQSYVVVSVPFGNTSICSCLPTWIISSSFINVHLTHQAIFLFFPFFSFIWEENRNVQLFWIPKLIVRVWCFSGHRKALLPLSFFNTYMALGRHPYPKQLTLCSFLQQSSWGLWPCSRAQH